MDPQQKAIAEEFDRYQTTYKDAVNKALGFSGLKVDFFTRAKADYLLDLLRDELGDPRRVNLLDVGCGVGNYHQLVGPKVGHLVGVDVSEACLAQARANNPSVDYSLYDGGRLPFADDSFDAVFAVCVMHHVPPRNWSNFVAEMRRVLRPGGLALIFEHNPLNPLTRRVVDRCEFDRDAVLLKARETVALFEQGRFTDVARRFILTVPAAGPVTRRIDRMFASLPFGAQYYVQATKPAASPSASSREANT